MVHVLCIGLKASVTHTKRMCYTRSTELFDTKDNGLEVIRLRSDIHEKLQV